MLRLATQSMAAMTFLTQSRRLDRSLAVDAAEPHAACESAKIRTFTHDQQEHALKCLCQIRIRIQHAAQYALNSTRSDGLMAATIGQLQRWYQ